MARQLSREHQQKAGQARFRQLLATIAGENPDNADKAAERISCIMLNWGFRNRRGKTSAWVIARCREYGIDVAFARTNDGQ